MTLVACVQEDMHRAHAGHTKNRRNWIRRAFANGPFDDTLRRDLRASFDCCVRMIASRDCERSKDWQVVLRKVLAARVQREACLFPSRFPRSF